MYVPSSLKKKKLTLFDYELNKLISICILGKPHFKQLK